MDVSAVVCQELGPVTGLIIEERTIGDPGPGEVRIDVRASGVNFVDALFVQGAYQIKPQLPFVPGSDVAGVIEAVGDGVDGWAVGDRVLTMVGLGGYATGVKAAAGRLVRIPDDVDFVLAAGMLQAYATARFALLIRAGLQQGEKVLVLGAGGGVGLACVDTARAHGAEVVAAASSPERLDLARLAGAAHTVDYTTEDLKTRVRELAGFVDVVVDPVGGQHSEPALRTLGEDGRFLVIGFASGEIPRLPANQILLRNRQVVGVDWGAWSMTHGDENQVILEVVMADVATGRLRPVNPTTYPLAEAASALTDLVERRTVGKVVLVP